MPAKSVLMVGLRGVGKTVLLDRMRDDTEAAGVQTIRIEAPEGRSLPALLAPQLRQALLRLSRNEKAKDLAVGHRKADPLARFKIAIALDDLLRGNGGRRSRVGLDGCAHCFTSLLLGM